MVPVPVVVVPVPVVVERERNPWPNKLRAGECCLMNG
jgi:hypothetical protein